MAKRRFIAGLIACLALSGPLQASPPTTAILGTPPQPNWSLLSTQQKIILAPLAGEWDQMENIRRKKWLGIADRFSTMSPEEKARIQQRMHEWAALTPDKRAKIRDSYKEFSQLPPEKRLAVKQKWETYSGLPDEEKQRVRQSGKLEKSGSPDNRPSTTSQPTETSSTAESSNSR